MNFSKEEDCGNLFYVYRSTFENKCSTWYLDSGCSNQMSRNQKIFLDIDSSITSKIQIGNGSIIDVKGKGIISVKTKKGPRHICDDLYVPDSEHNLFNFGQLIENSYFVHYEDGSCTIFDQKSVVIANVKMNSNRSFPVEF